MKRFMKHLKNTWKNKLVSIALIIIGYLSTLPEKDGTAFVFILMFAIPLFFAKNNHIS